MLTHLPYPAPMPPALLFITRKYPPGRGGMEEFSRRLYEAYPGRKRLVALRRGQGWLPLFLVRALAAARRSRGGAEHVHLGDALLTPVAPLFGRLAGAPVTATLHGLDCTRPLAPYRRLLRRSLPAMAGRLVAVSSYTAAQVQALYGVRPAVITNGVDVSRFACAQPYEAGSAGQSERDRSADGTVVVTVGRLVRRKGVAWFIREVMPLLPHDVSYVVVGDGPHRATVHRAAAGDPRVRLLGAADDDTVAQLYARADLFVAPNVPVPGQPEGYGIAPAEAAAAGLPVLVADLEGLRDMAADTGVATVPPGDARAWAAAIARALATPDAHRATRAARSWEAVASEYARFFATVGAAAGQPRADGAAADR
jgi:phosphatidyl-myo-inositol dimannoside synthase